MRSQTWMLSAQGWSIRLSVTEQWYYDYGIPSSIWWDVLFLEDLCLQVCDKIHILVSFSLRMTKFPHAKVTLSLAYGWSWMHFPVVSSQVSRSQKWPCAAPPPQLPPGTFSWGYFLAPPCCQLNLWRPGSPPLRPSFLLSFGAKAPVL